MCDDLQAEMSALGAKGVACSQVEEARWGSVTKIALPGGGEVGLYQPGSIHWYFHADPLPPIGR